MLPRKMTKFCANLNFLFTENKTTILERFRLAKAAGFRAVETILPNNLNIDEATTVWQETGLEVALVNMISGSVPNGQFGCASFPDNKDDFKTNLHETLKFAKALQCKKIHILAGKLTEQPIQKHYDTYMANLKYAISVFEKEDIIGVIEPICSYGVPGYYLNDFHQAVDIVKQLNSKHLKILFDFYHVQHLTGNLTNNLKDLMPQIGHVQIAQIPNRNEPNSDGELNFGYLFKVLLDAGYTDWIGCEYKPKDTTISGLKWPQDFNLSL